MTVRTWLRQLVVLAITCALTGLHTWPLARVWRTELVGGNFEDPWMNMWHLDWVRRCVLAGKNPFFADVLHYPLGAELYWHTLTPAKSLLGAALLPALGPAGSLNMVIVSTFVLTGMTAFWLCSYCLRSLHTPALTADACALLGACVFNFSRYHLCHAVAHMNLAALEGLPLFVLAFFRALDGDRRRWTLLAGVAAGYVASCDFYYVYYLALFAGFWMVGRVWSSGGRLFDRAVLRRHDIRRALLVAAVSTIFVLPAVLPLLLHLRPVPIAYHHGDSEYPADLLSPFLPDRLSMWNAYIPEAPRKAINLMQRGILNDIEGGCFWGICAPLLAIVALRRRVPESRVYLGLFCTFWLLSLGVYLNIGGFEPQPAAVGVVIVGLALLALPALRNTPWERDVRIAVVLVMLVCPLLHLTAYGQPAVVRIPLPYLLFKHLVPLFGRGGMPVRFLLMSQLCLAVLTALGAAHALPWLAARLRVAPVVAALVLLFCVSMETKSAALPTTLVDSKPQVFDVIRLDLEPDFAVYTDHVIGQWEETLHHRPVSFARQSRLPAREQALAFGPLSSCAQSEPRNVQFSCTLHHPCVSSDPSLGSGSAPIRAFCPLHDRPLLLRNLASSSYALRRLYGKLKVSNRAELVRTLLAPESAAEPVPAKVTQGPPRFLTRVRRRHPRLTRSALRVFPGDAPRIPLRSIAMLVHPLRGYGLAVTCFVFAGSAAAACVGEDPNDGLDPLEAGASSSSSSSSSSGATVGLDGAVPPPDAAPPVIDFCSRETGNVVLCEDFEELPAGSFGELEEVGEDDPGTSIALAADPLRGKVLAFRIDAADAGVVSLYALKVFDGRLQAPYRIRYDMLVGEHPAASAAVDNPGDGFYSSLFGTNALALGLARADGNNDKGETLLNPYLLNSAVRPVYDVGFGTWLHVVIDAFATQAVKLTVQGRVTMTRTVTTQQVPSADSFALGFERGSHEAWTVFYDNVVVEKLE